MNDRLSRRINRKQEVELKEFDKPVIDIDQSRMRKNMERRQLMENQSQEQTPRPDSENEQEQATTLEPPLIDGKIISPIQEQQQDKKKEPQQKRKLTREERYKKLKKKSLIMAFVASTISTILFSIAFLLLGLSNSDEIIVLVAYLSACDTYVNKEVYNLPFYAEKLIFSSMTFILVVFVAFLLNCESFFKKGQWYKNEFYTKDFETLKVTQLFYCLISGLLFFLSSFCVFYAWKVAQEMQLSSGINACLLTLITLFILIVHYMFYGKKIRVQQLIGSFISLLGLAVIAMTICKNQTDQVYMNSYNINGLKVVGFNILAVIMVGFIIILWDDVKRSGKIKYTTGALTILFFDGLISIIATGGLLLAGKLYTMDTLNVPEKVDENTILVFKVIFVEFIGILFAVSMLLMAYAMNLRAFSRVYGLVALVPFPLVVVETILVNKGNFNLSLLISMTILILGAFMIIVFEPKHKNQHKLEQTPMMPHYGQKKKEDMQKQVKDPLLQIEQQEMKKMEKKQRSFQDLDDFLKD